MLVVEQVVALLIVLGLCWVGWRVVKRQLLPLWNQSPQARLEEARRHKEEMGLRLEATRLQIEAGRKELEIGRLQDAAFQEDLEMDGTRGDQKPR